MTGSNAVLELTPTRLPMAAIPRPCCLSANIVVQRRIHFFDRLSVPALAWCSDTFDAIIDRV
jgi:hypothetical protein